MNLAPSEFWSLGVDEWRWLLGDARSADAMRLDELRELVARYPDEGVNGE